MTAKRSIRFIGFYIDRIYVGFYQLALFEINSNIDLDEFKLVGADEQSNHVLQGKENNHEVVSEVNDVGEPVVLNSSVLVLLQFLRCGDDKGDSGDQDHGEGEESQELSQFRSPGIFYCVPQPRPPQGPLTVTEVLLCCLLQHLPLLLQLPVLLTLQDVHLRVVLQRTARLHGQLVHPPVRDVLLEDQGAAALRGVEAVGPVHVQDSREVIRVLAG